jgi:hypothetical protein
LPFHRLERSAKTARLSDAANLTEADAGPVSPVGSVTVAAMMCCPSVNPFAGAQLQVPSSATCVVHTSVDPSWTVTDPSGSAVPEIDEASLKGRPGRRRIRLRCAP